MTRAALALVMAAVVGCATARPIVYANEKYQQVGRSGADRDIAECEELANRAGATPGAGQAGQAAKNAGAGTVVGAGAGAVGGAIGGSPGIGAAIGAASGFVWSLFGSMFSWGHPSQPSDVHKNYVDMCLADRGYQVAGWK
jgi:hypothetical protein